MEPIFAQKAPLFFHLSHAREQQDFWLFLRSIFPATIVSAAVSAVISAVVSAAVSVILSHSEIG